MQKPVYTLLLIMLLSLSVEANIKVILPSDEVNRPLAILPEADKASQASALIQKKALYSLLMSPAIETTGLSKQTIFEKLLRSDVRNDLLVLPIFQPSTVSSNLTSSEPTASLEVFVQWDETVLQTKVAERLIVLDNDLSKYLRINQSGTSFAQLKRLMPALYNIEERRALQALLNINGMALPTLKNAQLVVFLDKLISRMASDLRFNMKALAREGKEYEADLIAAMTQQALTFTAKPPDFVLDYKIVSAGQDKATGLWGFYGKISLLDQLQFRIASVEIEASEVAESAEQAQRQALVKMAEALSQNLRAKLLETH